MRRFITGVSSALAVMASLDIVEDDPDAKLVELCGRLIANRREINVLSPLTWDLLSDHPEHEAIWSKLLSLRKDTQRLAIKIGKMPTLTRNGLQARAAAIKAVLPPDFGIDDLVPINWHLGMLGRLLDDLMSERPRVQTRCLLEKG